MTEVASDPNIPLDEAVINRLRPLTDQWHTEVADLLPLTSKPHIYWFAGGPLLIDAEGVGGFAYAKNEISLVFDPDFTDKERQLTSFKGTYFHENYHLAQKFTGDNDALRDVPAVGIAIYEGAATVFERTHTGSRPSWGTYDANDGKQWLEEIKGLPLDYDWIEWKFYHTEKKEPHILYRTGAFVVDTALHHHPELKIEDLAAKPWEEILELSNL